MSADAATRRPLAVTVVVVLTAVVAVLDVVMGALALAGRAGPRPGVGDDRRRVGGHGPRRRPAVPRLRAGPGGRRLPAGQGVERGAARGHRDPRRPAAALALPGRPARPPAGAGVRRPGDRRRHPVPRLEPGLLTVVRPGKQQGAGPVHRHRGRRAAAVGHPGHRLPRAARRPGRDDRRDAGRHHRLARLAAHRGGHGVAGGVAAAAVLHAGGAALRVDRRGAARPVRECRGARARPLPHSRRRRVQPPRGVLRRLGLRARHDADHLGVQHQQPRLPHRPCDADGRAWRAGSDVRHSGGRVRPARRCPGAVAGERDPFRKHPHHQSMGAVGQPHLDRVDGPRALDHAGEPGRAAARQQPRHPGVPVVRPRAGPAPRRQPARGRRDHRGPGQQRPWAARRRRRQHLQPVLRRRRDLPAHDERAQGGDEGPRPVAVVRRLLHPPGRHPEGRHHDHRRDGQGGVPGPAPGAPWRRAADRPRRRLRRAARGHQRLPARPQRRPRGRGDDEGLQGDLRRLRRLRRDRPPRRRDPLGVARGVLRARRRAAQHRAGHHRRHHPAAVPRGARVRPRAEPGRDVPAALRRLARGPHPRLLRRRRHRDGGDRRGRGVGPGQHADRAAVRAGLGVGPADQAGDRRP